MICGLMKQYSKTFGYTPIVGNSFYSLSKQITPANTGALSIIVDTPVTIRLFREADSVLRVLLTIDLGSRNFSRRNEHRVAKRLSILP